MNSPAALHLFNIDPNQLPIADDKKVIFYNMVAKLLFVSKRGRPGIQVTIAFLTTRVTKPDIDNWKKLVWLLCYINSTIDLKLKLSITDFRSIKWWVNASYVVHPNSCSHTGGTMTLGKGSIYSSSIKQKITAKSLTEAELIALNDVAGQIIWTQSFLQDQGYNTGPSEVHQDNKSTILLAENRILSSSKRTKHINVRYYFIKDRINREEISIIYCPTSNLVAGYYTKPLQGSQYVKFRDMVMRTSCFGSLAKERVEDSTHSSKTSTVFENTCSKKKL